MRINYTPYAHLTDEELVREVCTRAEPTDLELELMHRLEYWTEYAATLEEGIGCAPARYKEAA